jgi:hypothetical protein
MIAFQINEAKGTPKISANPSSDTLKTGAHIASLIGQHYSTLPEHEKTMDAAFVPSEVVVKHFVHHKFTFELGPSVIALGKPIRYVLIGAAVIYCLKDLVRSSLQAVLKNRNTK